jgi:23S rRNA pseudouridine2605 synthase
MKQETQPRRTLSLNRNAQAVGPVVEERLQKVLAQAGLGSRRVIEERIVAGDIKVNSQVAEIGSSLRSGDRVELDGKAFMAVPTPSEEVQVLIYHKPEGELTTTDDPEGRKTVFERLPRLKGSRWIAIGRLDMNTTGLLLLSTDGELAHAMMHPSRELEREYVVRVHGHVTEADIAQLKTGIVLEDGPAHFDEIHVISMAENHSWFRVVLKEGRNREVRRMWEHLGLQVARLKRIRYGMIELPRELRRGHHRLLDAEQVKALREAAGLGAAPDTLTLQAVLGVRRATRGNTREYRPENARGAGWTSDRQDEARELSAFDRVRDDNPRPGGKRRPGGAPGGAPKPRYQKPGARRGAAPGQALDTASFLHSYPAQEGVDGNRASPASAPGGKRRGPGNAGKPPGRGRGPRTPAVFTGPMDSHQYTQQADPPPGRRGPPRGPR